MSVKLLVVDDCEDIRFLLSTLFSQMGYEVSVADCGEQAMEVLQKDLGINIVITDILMPKGDGLWLLKAIQKLNLNIPVFFITAGSDISRTDAINLGVVDLFRKPLNITEIEKALKRTLIEEPIGL